MHKVCIIMKIRKVFTQSGDSNIIIIVNTAGSGPVFIWRKL